MTARAQIPFADLASLPTYSSVSPQRLRSLYSDISRQKSSNPAAYQSIVTWWHSTLQAILAKGWQPRSADKLILHADPTVLPEALRYEGTGKPLCLGTVMTELAEAKHVFSLARFNNSTQSVYDAGWLPYRIASYVVGKPLWWALSQAGVVGEDLNDSERWKKVKGDYVVLALVEQAADAVIAQQADAGANLSDALYNFASFRTTFADRALPGVTLSDPDLRVLIKFLERDRKAIVTSKEVIKFVADTASLPEVTEVDHNVLEVKTAISKLQSQVEGFQQKIEQCTTQAQSAIKAKQEEVAKGRLRLRKQLNELLSQRIGVLENLQRTLQTIETAAYDIEAMKTYELSTSTLRKLLDDPALKRDNVDKTMDALAEANADAKEIDDAIVGVPGYEIDEDELANELEGLAFEERQKDEISKLEQRQKEKENVLRPATPQKDAAAQVRERVVVAE